MAVEITPLGFQKPDGYELVRNGDNAIAANAQKAQDILATHDARLANLDNAAGFTGDPLALNDAAFAETLTSGAATNAALDSRLNTKVPPLVAASIANDPTVANSAATMAQNTAGLVPVWQASTAYVAGQRIIAPNGDVAAAKVAFTSGTTYSAADWNASTQDGRVGVLETYTPRIPTKVPAAYVWGVTDATGYPAIAAEEDGTIRAPRINPASRTQISAMGDSLTNGYSASAAWALTDAWPAKLQGALTGVTVTNLGRSGATASELNFSVGAKQMWFTGTINASGSSTVTTLQGQAGFQRQFDVTGTLAGVAGTMRRLVDGTFSFTRSTSGTAVTINAPVKFKPTYGNRFGDIVIIGIGRNDVTYLGSTMGDGVIQHVVGAVQMVVDHLLHQSKRVIVTGTLTATNEPSGSVNHTRITGINDWLKQLYPAYWLDIRRYLIDKAITDLGITPTADDTAKIASDTLPPSIMDDSIHYSRATANILALNQYKPFLVEKGWV